MAEKKNGIPESAEDIMDREECFDPSKPLYNLRHERFAQLLFKGMKLGEAYVAAGFQLAAGQGAWIARNRLDVRARLDWLAEEAAMATILEEAKLRSTPVYEQQQAMLELEQARIRAMKMGRPSAAVAAIQTKARIAGLLKNEDMDPLPNARRPVREMSEQELKTLADEVALLIDAAGKPSQPIESADDAPHESRH